MGMTYKTWRQVYEPYIGLNSFSLYPTLMRPISRGWIRLNSTDPYEHPIIEANIFDKDQDVNVLVEGMKFALKIAQTPPFQRYNVKPYHTKFPGCESYPIYSDPYLACMARVYTYFNWHPCCTVKMGNPSDPTVVVDPQLRVKGVTNLRVVDGSIIPFITTGNLNAPIIMIAEKVADLIKGRRLVPFVPPMSNNMISRLPHLPYEQIS
jgi:choline dehydrogenase-like flavoprotein